MPVVNGWLDWAIKLPSTSGKINPGTNSAKGLFMHSAEGYASTLLDPQSEWGYNGGHTWHLSNLMDGRVFQHYPFTARCWHATAANQEYVGVENEGDYPKELSLNAKQVANAKRFIADIAAWKGWTPSRPKSKIDTSNTLWEHNEVTKLGGTGSSCPSGRIPWDLILEGDDVFTVHSTGKLIGEVAPQDYVFDLKRLGFPSGVKRVRFQIWPQGAPIEFYHGLPDQNNRDAGRAYTPYGIIEVIPNADGFCYIGPPGVPFDISPLGFYS